MSKFVSPVTGQPVPSAEVREEPKGSGLYVHFPQRSVAVVGEDGKVTTSSRAVAAGYVAVLADSEVYDAAKHHPRTVAAKRLAAARAQERARRAGKVG